MSRHKKRAARHEKAGQLCQADPDSSRGCRRGGYLIYFCLASEEDEHVPSGFMQVDMHGSVHRSRQVVLCMVLLAVHYLNIKGAPRHSEDRAVVEVGAELLPIQGG